MATNFSMRWLALLSILLAGCAAPGAKVRVDQAEGGLPDCRSFAWHPTSQDAVSLTDQRVHAAVMQRLEAKGYRQVAENPDCRIAYHMTTRELPKARPGVGVGVGGGSRGVGGGIGVSVPVGRRAAYSATFTLDVIDASKNAQVWSGTISTEVSEPELTEREAKRLVDEVLGAFPDAPQER